MIVRSLDPKKNIFRPKEDDKEILSIEVPYLNAIEILLYLAQFTTSNIAFFVNLLTRFSSAPICRHWNGINHIFRCFRGTTDLGLFFWLCRC